MRPTNLLQDVLLPVVPAQRPARGVVVQLRGGVQVRQDVVRQHGEAPTLAAVVVRQGVALYKLRIWKANFDTSLSLFRFTC